jgi:release factor glutamine methyltransferase
MAAEEKKTVFEVLKAAAAFLQSSGVPEGRRSCDLLMAHLLKCRPLEVFFKFDLVLEERLLAAMRRGVKRLAAGEPVQYILGQWDFMDHTFKVDRRALIPRPETELLVQRVLETESLWNAERPLVVDLGTGSGCIAICLALAKPAAAYLALDTSREALELAAENARQLGVADRVTFSEQELSSVLEPDMVTALIANLPYVPTAEYETLPSHIRDYEPRAALDGGPEGLSVIGPVIDDAECVLKDDGWIFLEIDHRQAEAVSGMLGTAGFSEIIVEKDLAGHDRIVSARIVRAE